MIQLAQAQALLARAIELAKELDRSISVSVVDERGHEVVGMRMDGASWFTLGAARAKAETAAAFQRPSAALEPLWVAHPALVPLIEQQLAFHPTTLAGGVPLMGSGGSGEIIGAVGVAGALPELDLQIAEMLASALLPDL